MFVALGRTAEFQQIETEHAAETYGKALKLCRECELWSERATALMFDITVQNGGIAGATKRLILADFETIAKSISQDELEVQKMQISSIVPTPPSLNGRRCSRPQLCCATAAEWFTALHDLERQYGIGLSGGVINHELHGQTP
jgi:hypothetical protein